MDHLKNQILKEYLANNADRWQMAEKIYKYLKRTELLSNAEKKMIQDFLAEDDKHKLLSIDIADNFEYLLQSEIQSMSELIGKEVMLNFPQIISAEFGGLAKHEHYINFDLPNKVKLQFRYSRYPYFNLGSIWVQFYKTGLNENEMKSIIEKIALEYITSFKWNSIYKHINHKFIDEDKLYETIFDHEEIERIIKSHSRLYGIVENLIRIFNIDLRRELIIA
ncbi:MAG: hypothetical protein JXC35_00870 [Acholeplasmataceae bacterium]|nr:hypothetical protein [Acholeplasmataceae bacterium]HEO99419.1 hypothetical protein [Campylobacterota bacterium]